MCLSQISLKTPKGRISVPCGTCSECLQKRRSEWTFRLMQELKSAKSAYFITYTYNNEWIPIYNEDTMQAERFNNKECKYIPEYIGVNEDTGEIDHKKRFNYVLKDDLQRFFKRLRKENRIYCKDQIRYYITNEYGEHTNRTHYHSIMYNIDPHVILALETIWEMGNLFIGEVTQLSIHYCTKYMLVPESENKGFALMSRRPFLGSTYLTINQTKYHKYNNQSYVSHYEGQKISMPRVYKDRIFPKEIEENGEKKKIQNIYRQVAGKKALDKHKEELQKREKKYKEKKLDYNTLERLSDKNKYKKMVKQSKSKNV